MKKDRMKITSLLFKKPVYDEMTREYVYPGGRRMTEIEYHDYMLYWKLKNEEQDRKMNCEYAMKVYETHNFYNKLLNGYAPSIALKN